jgi:hypothetical protein
MLLIMTSCDSKYVTVINAETGQVEVIGERQGITKLQDTLICRVNQYDHYNFHGVYVGVVPENKRITHMTADGQKTEEYSFVKVIRIK